MKKNIFLILLFSSVILIALSFIILVIYLFYFSSNNSKSNYSPSFISKNNEEVLFEIIDKESQVSVFLDKSKSKYTNLDAFNNEFEIFSFFNTTPNYVKVVPSIVLSETDSYVEFGFDNWVNVYCLGVFKDRLPQKFAVGRIYYWLAPPSDAWMCQGVDLTKYPE